MNRPHLPPGRAQRCDYHIVSAALPQAFSEFKIAHISDPHSNPATGILEIIKNAHVNITVITGDLLNDDNKPTDKIDNLIVELLKIAPVYFVSGNHDLWRTDHLSIFKRYEDMGAVFLDDKTEIFEKFGERISISGSRDPFSKLPHIIQENTQKSLDSLEKIDGFNILLFHRANLFEQIADYGFDLVLSGHMHGGQIRLPFLGGVLAPSSAILSKKPMLFPKYTGGTVSQNDTTMIINRGVGNTLPLPRLGNPPEVGIITLKRA